MLKMHKHLDDWKQLQQEIILNGKKLLHFDELSFRRRSRGIQSLQKIVGIKEVHGTLGLYDIVAQIECTTDEKIQEIVTQQIRKMPKIHSSMTLTSSESGQLFQITEKLAGAMLGQNSSQAYVVFHSEKGEEYPILKNLCNIPEVKELRCCFWIL